MNLVITNMDKKPDHCGDCPICGEYDECLLLPIWYETWEEQHKHCPLEEVPK